jgi:hypothetical protein
VQPRLYLTERLHGDERPDRHVRLLGALYDSRLRGHLRLLFANAIVR